MRYIERLVAVLVGLSAGTVYAACTDGIQSSGAKYRICMPSSGWNRQLLIYAHGYVSADQPVAIPEDQLALPDGTSLPNTFTAFGYAFATSSYRQNGLAVLEGVEDLRELTTIFAQQHGKPDKVYLGGVSEGGLVAALSAERLPNVYDAAIAACGPIGSFSGQINYVGDARVLFDYFFPGVLPGSVVSIPPQLWTDWFSIYVEKINRALASDATRRQSFLATASIPIAPDAATTNENATEALRYSAMAGNDAIAKLKGQPYDNKNKFYAGSTNDFELNSKLPRYVADAAAVQSMKLLDTAGKPLIPLVTLHTTGDPIVPWSHELGYFFKTFSNGKLERLNQIPVFRNGHCNFQSGDILWAFLVMLSQKSGTTTRALAAEMPVEQRRLLPAEVRKNLGIQ